VLTYNAGIFHITNTNDIVTEASTISGQGFYTNVPETLRQGVELGVLYNYGPPSFYGNSAHVDATYQFCGTFDGGNNPSQDANGNIYVKPGDRIPGIPSNLGKLGATYAVTPQLKVTAETVLVGSQFFAGDYANQNPKLPAYYYVNLRATYQLSDQVQIFGLINNATNNHYATYGAYYGVDTTAGNVSQTSYNNNPANGGAGNAQAVTVAQPISLYAGVKVTF
jgi:iron complex outermembrane receptor protein